MYSQKTFLFVAVVFSLLATSVLAGPYWCPDLTGDDDFVNLADFAVFANNWQQSGYRLAGDFDDSETVDINDLAYFVDYWLMPVDCPKYYADELPYMTSFEEYQGFTATTDPNNPASLDYQKGWQVEAGFADIQAWWAWSDDLDDYTVYQYVVTDANTVITKEINDEGSNHNYIRFSFIPSIDQKINIKNDSNTIASVWFNSDGYIYVLDNGSYVDTNVFYGNVYNDCWYYYFNSYDYENTFTDLKLKINWSSNNYEVYFDGGTTDIANQADFTQDFDNLTSLNIENTEDWYVLNSFSISGWSSDTLDIDITSPCACDTDVDLKGRVPIIGTASGTNFGKYDLYFCPVDLDTSDIDNWVKFDEGTNIVNNDVLGYWDTARIPNGYYHIAVVLFNDLGYPEGLPNNWFKVVTKTLSIGGQQVYNGPGYFAVVGDLKSNTFYHEEEPDISVSWAGQFPFELKRIYNNNRRFYSKPLRNGWTHNNQIILIEDCRYDWETEQSGPFVVPSWDENMLGMGYIWVKYPDGSARLFRHTTGHDDSDPVIYKPYPDDNTGEYIERYSYEDFLTVTEIDYYLHTRDGKTLYFNVDDVTIPWGGSYGSYGWYAKSGINSMSDRFGNSLSFGWSYDKTAVTSVSNGHATIDFDMQDGYYTEARLEVGQDVYRTIKFDYTDPNQGNPVFTVTRVGKGVNEQGVYDSVNDKEYVTKYEYDEGKNLRKIINVNDSSQDETLVEIDYDNYGRVQTRTDYVESANYLETTFDYIFDDPNVPGSGDNLVTIRSTDSRDIVTVQNEDGAVIWQETITSDGSAVTDANSIYGDSDNSLKPTEVYEYFDGHERYTWNDYSYYGDLIEQKTYVDDSNYIATELEYHPDYSFEISRISWQDVNKIGEKVQKISLYGDYDGSEDQHGNYQVKEKVLLYDGDPNDPNDNEWAITSYEYYNTTYKKGLVKKITDPNGFVALVQYDDNGYRSKVWMGTADANQPPQQRFYHDAIGQMQLQANYLGGVILNDYDDFGRLYKVRKYSDPDVMSLSDQNFTPARYEQMTALSTVEYGYDTQENRTFEKLEAGGEIDTTYTYNGLPKRKTFDDNSYIEFSYDTRGNKTQEYRYEYTDQVDWYVTFGYDSMDRLTETNWFDYNDTTIVKSQTSEYYGTGKKKYDQFYGYGGILEKKVGYNYNILTRLTSTITDPEGLALTTSYDYDAAGNRISVTDPNGSVIYFDYDNANRKIAEYFTTEVEADPNIKKEIGYYENNLVKDVNSYDYDGMLLARSEYVYDARRRITKVTQDIDDVNQAVTIYDYNDSGFVVDGNEHQIRITDANYKCTYVALDAFVRRVKTLYPSEDYEEVEYNGDGTLAAKAVWDANDTKYWIEYYYDGYARLIDVNYPDGGNVHYTYDGFGRKTLVEDNRNATDNVGGTGEIAYEYDVLDRVDNITEHDGYKISYTYQADGQKQSIKVAEPNESLIYHIEYWYDIASRLETITEPPLGVLNDWIVEFEYDKNGNRKKIEYFRTGSLLGATVSIDYTYDLDNNLTGFTTTGGPTFSFTDANIDGLGRLTAANETITKTDGNTVEHSHIYEYDMRSQLTYANITNIGAYSWVQDRYSYDKAGNLDTHEITTSWPSFTCVGFIYNGDLMTAATGLGDFSLAWDLNGNMKNLPCSGITTELIYNWDNKLRSGQRGGDLLSLKYDLSGNRIWKQSSISGTRKYIVDIVGELPVILLVIDPNDDSIAKTYIHANGQIIAQHDGDYNASRYFYMHDRLGSVRQIMNTSGGVVNRYVFDPFGQTYSMESEETITNPFKFAGQYFDEEIIEYYLRARQYDPHIARFTTRDPVFGKFREPLTLHVYLYCLNDPVNRIDPSGEFGGLAGQLMTNAIRGALMGALTGGMTRGLITQSWSGVVEGALYGAIGGGISGGLVSFSAAGYMFAAIESSPALQGMIAGGSAGIAEGVINREDLRAIFTRAMIGSVGGLAGGYLGYIEPQAISGIPGGIAGGQMVSNFYEFFFSFFGGYPSLDE